MTTWTREAIEALGPVTDVPTMAAIVMMIGITMRPMRRRGLGGSRIMASCG